MYEIFEDQYHLTEVQLEKIEFDNPVAFQYETGNERQVREQEFLT